MWIKQLGSSEQDFSKGIVTDSSGNVFISGDTEGTLGDRNAGSSDTWIAKYDDQGNLIWTRQLGTPDLDRFQGIATDLNGNVYLTGSTLRTLEGTFTVDSDAWLAKYDGQGNLLWNQQLGSDGSETSSGVATASNGNIYVSGAIQGTTNGAWVTQYDGQGNLLGTLPLNISGSEVSAGIAIDADGNFYVSGDDAEDGDAVLAKYDSQGNLLWNQIIASAENDYSQAVTVDSSGNVYISGGTNGNLDGSNAGLNDAWVSKYDSQGNIQWTRQLGTVGNDSSEGVTVDSRGNVYISGTTNDTLGENNIGGSDAWVAKYDSQGNLLWTQQLGSPEDDDSQGVAIDNNGNLYISGSTQGSLDGANAGRDDAWVTQITQPSSDGGNNGNPSNGGDGGSLLNIPITRFQNRDLSGTYLFAGPEESQEIRNNFPNFVEEGQAFKVSNQPGDNLIAFNRFQNRDIPGTYLYAGEEESQSIRASFPNFIEEGVAFYVYPGSADIGVDIYRLQNLSVPGTYTFVGEAERQSILANFSNFADEGVAFEVEF